MFPCSSFNPGEDLTMNALIEEAPPRTAAAAAWRLRTTMAAVRVSFTALGVHKSLSPQQKSEAADAFGAADQFISAGKKLLDTRHPAFRAVTSVRTRIVQYWKGITLPYPEPGIRLLRIDHIDEFDAKLSELEQELAETVSQLDEHYAELKLAARERLGRLFNADDYPLSLAGLFGVEWDFPSIEPPAYLQQVNPALFEQESQRIAGRFNEALGLAEQAFRDELGQLISHLSERLAGSVDGKPKIFRDSAITNLVEFFERFRRLNVRSSEELDQLVDQARQVVEGIPPQSLRDNGVLRQSVAGELAQLQTTLDGLLVDRPRRNILRRHVSAQEVA
jgi:hypothetical protein